MQILTTSRVAFSLSLSAVLLTACGGSQLPAATSPSGAVPFAFKHHRTFSYTGSEQTFKVPRGVTSIRIIAIGASGAGSLTAYGGRVTAVVPVAPLETLAIYVGGAGTSSNGGFNGGGAGGQDNYGDDGYGAGGGSDVREGGNALADRIVVAGGGGGAGFKTTGGWPGGRGGLGGGTTGGSGKAGQSQRRRNGGGGGTGGTQTNGGVGGKSSGAAGQSGQSGDGGAGGSGCTSCGGYVGGGGGGGGGGYYGGGGGGGGAFFGSAGSGGGGGGGGGSSYVEPSGTHVKMWRGWKAINDALITIDW
jgi:hypothetical protein